MKRINYILFIAGIMSIAINSSATEITKIFPVKGKVKSNTVSGDLKVINGTAEEITVNITYTFEDDDISFDFDESDNSLSCIENFSCHSFTGKSKWTITVPKGTDIDFNSSSGNFEIENSTGDLDIKCSSGNIEARNTKGKLNLHSSSGHVKVQNCQGFFELYSSSGDITAKDLTIKGSSSFISSSGNAYVVLNHDLTNDVSISSSSGNAIMDFNGTNILGNVEMTARDRFGEIKCPIDFENEKTYANSGQDYITKSFRMVNDSPLVKITTASGRDELVK